MTDHPAAPGSARPAYPLPRHEASDAVTPPTPHADKAEPPAVAMPLGRVKMAAPRAYKPVYTPAGASKTALVTAAAMGAMLALVTRR